MLVGQTYSVPNANTNHRYSITREIGNIRFLNVLWKPIERHWRIFFGSGRNGSAPVLQPRRFPHPDRCTAAAWPRGHLGRWPAL